MIISGGAVQTVQTNLANLNILVLVSKELPALLTVFFLGGLAGAGLFLLGAFLVVQQPAPTPGQPAPGRWDGLRYALPMLLVWGLYLLAFWPAMLAPDSINQWQQARSGHFETGHPLLHTLFLWLLMQIWDSPALVALVQVTALALLTGGALEGLRRRGLPGWAAWGTSALFALSPVNGAMTVTIWKDTPYSIAVFALSLALLNISLDPERWLSRKSTGLLLGTLFIFVGLFRLNGIVIIPAVLAVLLWVYPRYWRRCAAALALFALAWGFVEYPLSALLRVEGISTLSASIPMHHIASHLHYGTQPTPEEQAVLDQILPIDQWPYYCYSINPLNNAPGLNKTAAVAANAELYQIMLNFFLRNPSVDINHTLCAGTMLYRVFTPDEGYLLTNQIVNYEGIGIHYIAPNDLGITESPALPWLNEILMPFQYWTASRGVHWLVWSPALYLYGLVFLGAVLMLRARSWKIGLFLVPALVQTGTLFLTNVSQSFRYQYAVYLISLFALVLLFLPLEKLGTEN